LDGLKIENEKRVEKLQGELSCLNLKHKSNEKKKDIVNQK